MQNRTSRPLFSCLVATLICSAVASTVRGQARPAIQFGLAFSHDSSMLATCGDRVCVYELMTGQLVREIDGRITRAIAFSPAVPDQFAAGGDDGVLRVWRVGKKDFVQELQGHEGMITSVAFEKSGQYAASASIKYQKGELELGQFRLWELKTGKAVESLEVKEGGIQGISFSNDGSLVAFCRNPRADPCQVDVYAVRPWKAVASVKLLAGEHLESTPFGKAVPLGMSTFFEPHQQRLVVAGGICIRVDPRPYAFACEPTGLLWSADFSERPSARLLNDPSRGYYRALGLAPNGKRFATGHGQLVKEATPQLELREVPNGKVVWSVASEVEPYGVTVTPDGKFVAACQRDGIRLLNAETGETVRLIAAKK